MLKNGLILNKHLEYIKITSGPRKVAKIMGGPVLRSMSINFGIVNFTTEKNEENM